MNPAARPCSQKPLSPHGTCRPLLRHSPRAVADPAWFTETHTAGPSCPWPRWETASFAYRQAQASLAQPSWTQKSRTLAVQTAKVQVVILKSCPSVPGLIAHRQSLDTQDFVAQEETLSQTARLEACLSSDPAADMETQPAWLSWWRYQGLKF